MFAPRGAARWVLAALLACSFSGAGPAGAQGASAPGEDAPIVVIDPGHGGDDYGAVGRVAGLLEKDVVLDVSSQIGRSLSEQGVRVIYTRTRDEFVTLANRTEVANREGADFYLSIHANASQDPAARGLETYFLSMEASDADARKVAAAENRVFARVPDPRRALDVGSVLRELAVTDNMRSSRRFALALHRQLRKLPGPSRGVKQAEFVVLGGVNMPSALIELGFVTNEAEEALLARPEHHQAIAGSVTQALAPLLAEAVERRKARARANAAARGRAQSRESGREGPQ